MVITQTSVSSNVPTDLSTPSDRSPTSPTAASMAASTADLRSRTLGHDAPVPVAARRRSSALATGLYFQVLEARLLMARAAFPASLRAAASVANSARYDPIRDAILTCAQKLTRVSLVYRTEPQATTGHRRNHSTGPVGCVPSNFGEIGDQVYLVSSNC